MASAALRQPPAFTQRNGPLDRYFYLAMSLAFAAVVAAWIIFVILQSALIRTRNLRWHRLLGWAGATLAALMIPLGLATAVIMVRFEIFQLHLPDRYAFLAVPFYDVLAFSVSISLAILWRTRPEFHRLLIFFATGALLLAAFARVDHYFLGAHGLQDLETDLLLACGPLRDLLVNRRIHSVYRIALPLYFAGQAFVVYLASAPPAWWLRLAHAILA